jgi:hypothetical protein
MIVFIPFVRVSRKRQKHSAVTPRFQDRRRTLATRTKSSRNAQRIAAIGNKGYVGSAAMEKCKYQPLLYYIVGLPLSSHPFHFEGRRLTAAT